MKISSGKWNIIGEYTVASIQVIFPRNKIQFWLTIRVKQCYDGVTDKLQNEFLVLQLEEYLCKVWF